MQELKRMFLDVNRNASTRAISDLKQIVQFGWFVFSHPREAAVSMMNISEISLSCLRVEMEDKGHREITFDELEQLRNRLMLASDILYTIISFLKVAMTITRHSKR
jgi:hypothetical protein